MSKVLKKFTLIVFITMMFFLSSICLFACDTSIKYDSDVSNFVFELQEDDTYAVVSYTGDSEYVSIPETYNEKEVTVIGSYFASTSFKGIFIPKTILLINDLKNCDNLESIVVDEENTVYHSKDNCLIETENKSLVKGCKTSIIPADGSVKNILKYSFYFVQIETITIPESVTYIEQYSFSGTNKYLKNVYFENTENWYYTTSVSCDGFSSENLSDSSLAAIYLHTSYKSYDWRVITD